MYSSRHGGRGSFDSLVLVRNVSFARWGRASCKAVPNKSRGGSCTYRRDGRQFDTPHVATAAIPKDSFPGPSRASAYCEGLAFGCRGGLRPIDRRRFQQSYRGSRGKTVVENSF